MCRLLRILGGCCAAAILAASTATPTPAAAGRPFSVDDLLSMEMHGQAVFDPSGRWLVFERQGPYDAADRYDREFAWPWPTSTINLVDLARPEAPIELLLPPGAPGGQVIGGWSPSGERLLIYSSEDGDWRAGVVDLKDRSVVWLPLSAEMSGLGRAAQWRDDDRLILLVRPDGSPPWPLRFRTQGPERLIEAWRFTLEGRRPSRTVVESGRLASTDAGSDNLRDVVEVDLKSGVIRPLLTGPVLDLETAPDGRGLAIVEGRGPLPIDRTQPLRTTDMGQRRGLRIIDLATGAVSDPMPDWDIAPNLLTWSSDGAELMVWRRQPDRSWASGQLMALDVQGKSRILPSTDLRPRVTPAAGGLLTIIHASWLGATPIMLGRTQDDDRDDWFALQQDAPVNLTSALPQLPRGLAALTGDTALLLTGDYAWRMDVGGAAPLPHRNLRRYVSNPAGLHSPPRLALNPPRPTDAARFQDAQGALYAFGAADGMQPIVQGAAGLRAIELVRLSIGV